MNIQESDVLKTLIKESYTNQRILAKLCGHSLGVVNKCIKNLIEQGYLDDSYKATKKAIDFWGSRKTKKGVILAAGYGMRMAPISHETTKGLLELNGEPLVERIISQLHEVGIREIYVVAGFMKEKYEYLIDEYGVELVVNAEYSTKNNLHSVKLISEQLSNCYVIPCDLWCAENPFSESEMYSWYMVSEELKDDSFVRINRKQELALISDKTKGNAMIGITYLDEKDGEEIQKRVKALCGNPRYDMAFWEEALYENDKFTVMAKLIDSKKVIEINTFEQLQELDELEQRIYSEAFEEIANVFQVNRTEIINIELIKKGMSNRSFLFEVNNKKYILRIPTEKNKHLINRSEECEVYNMISEEQVGEKVVYLNPIKGYKVSEYWENVKLCDPFDEEDVGACMEKLKAFHNKKMTVQHEFDIFEKMEFYESLWEDHPSVYKDYKITKERVLSLREYVEQHAKEKVLSHMDAVYDNFLFVKMGESEEVRLIDWEYAGMQDPHVDIAMFAIYALYKREQVDKLIDLYFEYRCEKQDRIKIYCYIAICGLMWSNWCEYKRLSGVDFGEYALRQYRYAKEYYKIVKEEEEHGI